ncbi:elicitin-like protein [Plasmopara halstedii]|uniref:Elicitin-like protein n=1 Tax=Plasmopara halstedii TaxID=4781 RepID=A0A0P1AB84_PLAHL|nr:elicitin-like protein [Plasmopara halstedii]CEG37662.1 elicitin-like protein [Plasmopara halstedii]|eukprot:XP_024574031.1 elicitin-like protein [Plasmopara halstedii]
MKLSTILSAATLIAVTDADPCDVTSLSTLLTSKDTTTCSTASGYAVTSLASPTEKQMAIMCSNEACQSVISQIQTLAPSECTLGQFALYADLLTPLNNICKDVASSEANTQSTTDSATNNIPESPPTLTFANVSDTFEPAEVSSISSTDFDPIVAQSDNTTVISATPSDNTTVTPTTPSDDVTVTSTTPSDDTTLSPSTPSDDKTVSSTTPSIDQTTTPSTDLVASEDSSNSQAAPSISRDENSTSLDPDLTLDNSKASVATISAGFVLVAVAAAIF